MLGVDALGIWYRQADATAIKTASFARVPQAKSFWPPFRSG
jgi:hypothetical protein